MPQPRLLAKLVKALDDVGIDYMITGSIASSEHGEPRSTHDIDVVVALSHENLAALAQAFPEPEFFLDLESAQDAVAAGHMFNLIAVTEGDKVDFWPLSSHDYDRTRFGRKSEEDFLDVQIKICSAEDTILSKLQWSVLAGGSESRGWFGPKNRERAATYAKTTLHNQ